MIDRQQLAEALARLDPRDREILYLSLGRRVPDEDLAEVFEGSVGDVVRMRAAAVERLSDAMGVEQGSDLGHMLKELLDPSTWEIKPPSEKPRAPGEGHRPVGATAAGQPAPPRDPVAGEPVPERAPVADQPEPPPASERTPVLDMLEQRPETDRLASPPAARRHSGARRLAVAVAVMLALLVPAGVVAALTSGQPGVDVPGSGEDSSVRAFEPKPEAIGQPFPSDPKAAGSYPVARIVRKTVLHSRPRAGKGTRVGPKTEFDSPRILSVVKQRDGWLAVLAPELRNGELGWIEEGDVERIERVSVSLHADLSERVLVVRRDGKPVRRMRIGVGRSTNPTPTGRYAVTDKLRVSDPGSPYGCCVLALNGHQVKLPEGWPGGDRLAVHATRDTSGLGQAVSLGCMRTDPKDARWMLDAVPLGAPVFVKS